MAIDIEDVARSIQYVGSGTGPYAFTFNVLAQTDIAVYRDDTLLTLTTDYTVTVNADGTGSVTTVASMTGYTVTINGARPYERTTDYSTGGDFPAATINNELDSILILIQQLLERSLRGLTAPQTDPTTINMILPASADRAGKILGFDSLGDPRSYDADATFSGMNVTPIIATAGQTVFAIGTAYVPGVNSIAVYQNGLRLRLTTDYVETDANTITLTSGAALNDELVFASSEYLDTGLSASALGTTYEPAGTGAVTTNVQTKLRESVSVKDFGAVGDGVTDDTLAIVAFHQHLESIGDGAFGLYPPGVYVFSPNNHYSVANAWREAVEFVDVNNITLVGYGATLKQVIPSGWEPGDSANYGNDEGPIQFRSTGDGTCANITVKGISIEMQKLTYVATDGNDMGIALRGVSKYRLIDCNVTNASTDGIYCGATYSDTYGGADGLISNCNVDNSNRNGLSIVKNSNVRVIGGSYTNSSGGSMQAGIDLEPNSGGTQENIIINGVHIAGNGLRGVGIIRSANVVISNCTFANDAKEISIEGASSAIQIKNNVFTLNSTAGLGVDVTGSTNTDIDIDSNHMYMPAVPTYFIRIGSGGVTGYKNFSIRNNTLVGESGISIGAVGGFCDVSGNLHDAKVIGGSVSDTNVFTWFSTATNLRLLNNKIVIDSSLTWSGTQLKFAVANGWGEGNTFESHSGAVGYCPSRTAAYPIQYGLNTWSTYFYYDENLSNDAFRIKGRGIGMGYLTDGYTAANYGGRVVTGGFTRTTTVAAVDNQVGDVTYLMSTTTGNPLAYRCTVAGVAGSSAGTWVGLYNKT